jgi:two-component system, NtrC family, C4-dicarboxylate transport response regulator DctD
MNPAILVVDDNDDNRVTLSTRLQICGYSSIALAADGKTALERMRADPVDLVLLDILMPGLDGYGVLRKMKSDASLRDVPVVMVSAIDDPSSVAKCIELGAVDYLTKPFNPVLLKERVASCIELTQWRNRRPDELEAKLIGESAAMSSLRQELLHIAGTNVPVLITGETGAGKEVVAQCIHAFSGRSNKPFVAVNCAAIPETMFESEFFGHEAGAFTGASARRIGRFEHANGGTLLLDEIEAMPLSLQAKLLRVLQDQTLERLGSNKTISVDVRILAASKVDLYKASQAGRFREDLYFRLNVAELNIPPLRARREDIPILFQSFVAAAAKRYRIPVRIPTEDEMDYFAGRPWPGNVRELRTAAERFVLRLGSSNILSRPNDVHSLLPLADQVAVFERRTIETTLRHCRGDISAVLVALDLPRRTLYHKMQRYGLSREDFIAIDQDDGKEIE